ncbi:MAG: phenylalanine--tRNA ligase subunit beta [Firmicutes bacterium]|nr:phenylalanine--tRNA ligase subunit beta [Bacillota bacterium]
MKLSLNWLNDYVDTSKISVKTLAERLSLSTAEVELIEERGQDRTNLITAKIVTREAIEGTKLSALKVDAGDGKLLDVVCGAPNARAGLVVCFSPAGARLGEMTVAKTVIRGHESNGMCLSADELGICEERQETIIELPNNTKLGLALETVVGYRDTILHVDPKSITNRPDLFCHYGFAREIAAIFDLKLKAPKTLGVKEEAALQTEQIKVKIENKELCRRYSAIKFSNIKNESAPLDIFVRLNMLGNKSVNMLSDITNYVMLDIGQPMHAFCFNKLKPSKKCEISVEQGVVGTPVRTLDNKDRTLPANALTININNKVEAIAGVIGCDDAKTDENTTNMILESATFDATSIRRTRTNLGVYTEASKRYEKTLDPELTLLAIDRFYYLLKKANKNAVVSSGLADNYPNPHKAINLRITKSFIDGYMGKESKAGDIEKVLTRLGFVVTKNKTEMNVLVPSWRATKDVKFAECLVEEYARIVGYASILPAAPTMNIEGNPQPRGFVVEQEVKKHFAQSGFNEVHTYIWSDTKLNQRLGIVDKSVLRTMNSVNKDNNDLRTKLYSSLIKVVEQNKKTQSEIRVFEIGKIMGSDSKEAKRLSAIIATGEEDKDALEEMRDLLHSMFNNNFNAKIRIIPYKDECNIPLHENNFHINNTFSVYCGDIFIGVFGLINPRIRKNIDRYKTIAMLEIRFEELLGIKVGTTEIESTSRFPTTTSDFTFVVGEETKYFEFEKAMMSFRDEFAMSKRFITDYDVGNGRKTFTVEITIGSREKTLTSAEIEVVREKFVRHMIEYGYSL